jgi:hypothetical protein
MNLFNFKQTTSYFNKKRPIVYLLLAFSLVCMGVSIQSGTVFIHSFLSSYIPDVAWFWCYTVAVFIDICLFYLCAQFFSDMFGGIDNEQGQIEKTLDPPTAALFLSFLAFSLFISVKGADIRKSYHAVELATDNTAKNVVDKLTASMDTAKTVISGGISRDARKAIEGKAALQEKTNKANDKIISALELHHEQKAESKKEFGELLDFSKTVVIIFQLLLILCCSCSEYIKSRKESKSESPESPVIAEKSTIESKPESNNESTEEAPKSKKIGFDRNEGDIIWNNGKPVILYAKAKGGFARYTRSNLKSQIGYYGKQGKLKQVDRLKGLLFKLEAQKVDA